MTRSLTIEAGALLNVSSSCGPSGTPYDRARLGFEGALEGSCETDCEGELILLSEAT